MEIEYLNKIKTDHHVVLPNAEKIETYGLSDISELGYGACIYLASTVNGNREIKLLTAKSRVAPIKKQPLLQLELLAAHLLAELVFKIKSILDIEIHKTIYFTDSTIVLAWLKTEPCQLKTFVTNRVAKISEISNINDWRHVKSKNNAADIIWRGLSPKEILDNKKWFQGPEFLKFALDTEVQDNFDLEKLPELKGHTINLNIAEKRTKKISTDKDENNVFALFKKYTSFWKLVRVFGYVCRFKNRSLLKIPVTSENLSIKDLNAAKEF